MCHGCAGEVCGPRVSAGDVQASETDGSTGPEGPSGPDSTRGGTGTGTAERAGKDHDGLGVAGSEAAVLLSAVIVGRMARGRRGDLRPPVGRDCLVDDEGSPTVFVLPVCVCGGEESNCQERGTGGWQPDYA